MSLDYVTIASESLPNEILRDFRPKSGTSITVTLDSESSASISFANESIDRADILVYGPISVTAEELDESKQGLVESPVCEWHIHLHSNSKNAVANTLDLASYLARTGSGVTIDLQTGEIIFPSRRKIITPPSRPSDKASGKTLDAITLDFALPYKSVTDRTASDLLAIFEQVYPAARPIGFGISEHLGGKLKPGFDGPFLDKWREILSQPSGDTIYWKATNPFFQGSMEFSRREEWGPTPIHVQRRHILRITLEASDLETDREDYQRIIDLFEAVSKGLKAFWGTAYLGRISHDGKEKGFIGYRNFGTIWWVGLNGAPAWLTWFGPAYSRLVSKSLDASPFVKYQTSAGTLVCMGDKPTDFLANQQHYPPLPKELLMWQDMEDKIAKGYMNWTQDVLSNIVLLEAADVVPILDEEL